MLLGRKLCEASGEHLITSIAVLGRTDGVWGDALPSRVGEVVPDAATDVASVRACLGASARQGDLVPESTSTGARLGDCVPERTSTGGKVDDRISIGVSIGARPTDRLPERASADACPGDHVPEGSLTACRAVNNWPSKCVLLGLVVPNGCGLSTADG